MKEISQYDQHSAFSAQQLKINKAIASPQSNHRLLTSLLVLALILFSGTTSFATPVSYIYDEANRLLYEDRPEGTIVYVYDEVGNLTGRNFYQNYHTLTVEKAGNGNGTVSGGGYFPASPSRQITATAAADSTFTGWSGDCQRQHDSIECYGGQDKDMYRDFHFEKLCPHSQ